MRLHLTCRETTRLVLEGEDRTLALSERALIRIHLGMCKGCTRFSKQVRLMRAAMDGWRRYSGPDNPP
jgi:predicted anti-sigma-YlaC factor YlaD